jgi:subtilase family serine protease
MPARKYPGAHFLYVAVILIFGVCPVFGADWKTLHGHVPAITLKLTPEGRLAATKELHLAIGLPPRDAAGLDAFLAQLYDPKSPGFHQYLTPDEAAARFGPSADDYETVKNFARANGLTVIGTYSNRLILDVAAPAAAVEKAFHITLRTYHHPTEARDFFAPDTEPAVDALLPVADIQGLSDFAQPHPRFHRVNASHAAAVTKIGTSPGGSGLFFGNDFRTAYAPDTTLTGAGQSVGLFEADGFYASDIAAYAAAAGNGRTNIVIQTVKLDGFSGTPTSSGNDEVSLDIEMAMAMAPGLTRIVVYEGNPNNFFPNDILNSMLSSNTVKNLSSSWGWNGGANTTTDNIFKNMAAVGQSFFNAAGDSDAFTTGASSANGVDNPSLNNAPSSCPYITQVGGTTLSMNGAGASYASETVWNWGYDSGAYVGTSGGISSAYTIPAWQTSANAIAAGGSSSFRNIPDVALTADAIYVTSENGSAIDLGGTSCAAPLWAGFIALANQQAVSGGRPAVGFVNPALYAIAAGSGYANCFHDVTTGNNFSSTSPSQFSAGTGYDLCTGLGTPAGQHLINALAGTNTLAVTNGLVVSPLADSAVGVAGGPFTVASGSFLLTNSSSSSLTWSLVNTSSWLNVSPVSGTLTAGGVTSLTCTLAGGAATLAAGTYNATLTFSNATALVAQPVQFNLQVSQPLLVSPAGGFAASGNQGGPFNVTSQNFVLTNQSVSSLSWNIMNLPAWLNATPAAGILAGNAQTSVTISLNPTANTLAAATYSASLLVTNFAGLAATLPFSLSVNSTNTPPVVNGGFETGDLTGWTLGGSTGNDFVTTNGSFVHSGSYGLELGQSASLGYLSQTLVTVPGQNYLLSLWLANPGKGKNATPNQFLVQWNGTTLYNQGNIPSISWTNLQFVVTATGVSTVLQFGFDDTHAYLALDDISVTPISAPVFKSVQQPPHSTAFNLSWSTTANQVYQVQYTTNLFQPNWINLGGTMTATGSVLTLQDTNSIYSTPSRYYRIVEGP